MIVVQELVYNPMYGFIFFADSCSMALNEKDRS